MLDQLRKTGTALRATEWSCVKIWLPGPKHRHKLKLVDDRQSPSLHIMAQACTVRGNQPWRRAWCLLLTGALAW